MGDHLFNGRHNWDCRDKYVASFRKAYESNGSSDTSWHQWSTISNRKSTWAWEWYFHGNRGAWILYTLQASEVAKHPFKFLGFVLYQVKTFFKREAFLTEILSGIATLSWGVYILWATPPPDRYSLPSLELLIEIINSNFWAYTAIFIGIGQIILFRIIDNNWERPWLRWIASLISGWIWALITLSILQNHPTALMAASGTWCLANAFLIFRIFWARE